MVMSIKIMSYFAFVITEMYFKT